MIFFVVIASMFATTQSAVLLQKGFKNDDLSKDQSANIISTSEETVEKIPDTVMPKSTEIDYHIKDNQESSRQKRIHLRIFLQRPHMKNKLVAKYFARLNAMRMKNRRRNNSFFNPVFNYLGVQIPRNRT